MTVDWREEARRLVASANGDGGARLDESEALARVAACLENAYARGVADGGAAVGRQVAGCVVAPPLEFEYRNHRGEVAWRRVRPAYLWHGATAWHAAGWKLRAVDVDRGVERDFALAAILRMR